MSAIYAWKDSSGDESTAQLVGETLERIEKENGELTPGLVVEEASHQGSPLHAYFEWDDNLAAHQYRLDQARGLIQRVFVRHIDEAPIEKPTRAFVNLVREDGARSYEHVVTVMSDELKRARLLAQAKRELQEWMKRYESLHELAALFEEVKKVA